MLGRDPVYRWLYFLCDVLLSYVGGRKMNGRLNKLNVLRNWKRSQIFYVKYGGRCMDVSEDSVMYEYVPRWCTSPEDGGSLPGSIPRVVIRWEFDWEYVGDTV